MLIANFREYTAVLRNICSRDVMGEIGTYYLSLLRSGEKLKRQKQELQQRIRDCKQKIERQAELIRQTENKKEAGLRLAEIKKQKQELVHNFKILQNGDHFNVLSTEAKIGVCCGFLLQKYLTRELLENNPLNFRKNAEGNLVVDPEVLENSEFFQEAVHLRDFIAAYMLKYPDKVKTPGHFKTLLNGVNDWRGVLDYADNFFNRLSEGETLSANDIEASRQGVEVIRTFPAKNLQLVRLRTPAALDYESAKMDHCIGRGAYDAKLTDNFSCLYSLRDMSPDGEWIPHATIEYKEGKIEQIKGRKNGKIEPFCRPEIEAVIADVLENKNILKLQRQGKVRDLQNIGYTLDDRGNAWDLDNLKENIKLSKAKLAEIPPASAPFIEVDTLEISGRWTDKTTTAINSFRKIREFSLKNIHNTTAARKALQEYADKRQKPLNCFFNSGQEMCALGFGRRLQPEDTPVFISLEEEANLWIDLINLNSPARISTFVYNDEVMKLINPDLISIRSLTVGGTVTPATIKQICRLHAVANIHFQNADFSRLQKLDLSGLHMDTRQQPANAFQGDEAGMITDQGKFITYISKFVNGGAVRFSDCTNIPAFSDISLPPDIRHLTFDADKRNSQITDADFRQYRQLETLQLNNCDLRESRLSLPEHIRYLGLSSCQLKPQSTLDFTPFPDLAWINLRAAEVGAIDTIVFPAAMTQSTIEETDFTNLGTLDFSACQKLENLCFGNISASNNDCRNILFPPNLKQLEFTYSSFPAIKELDLSASPKLKEISFRHTDFPKLRQITAPVCNIKQEHHKMPADVKITTSALKNVPALPAVLLMSEKKQKEI